MRGITTVHYRRAFIRHFQGLDLAMAPFIPTVKAERINPKLLKDLLPEENADLPLIPQLIGNHAADFVHMAKALHELGYQEINWNLGCPHKPIRNKRRGSGLLPHPDMVDVFLEEVFRESPCRVSVKVRLGVSSKTELLQLIPVLNKYPLSEVIIHPRTAEQMYDGKADLDAFEEAFAALVPPVCYNGDINGPAAFRIVQERFPTVTRLMLGRGLLSNPFLCESIKNGSSQNGKAVDRIIAFHDDLLAAYEAILHGDHPVLGKMKEFWTYQSVHLSNGAKMFKKLKKTRQLSSYRSIVSEFLREASWNAPS
jgi:tRNA-dihydrouridine synthase